MNKQQKIAIGAVVGVLLIIGLIAWFSLSKNNETGSIITDRDTGEAYNKEVIGREHTGADSEATGSLILFGIEPLIKTIRESKDNNTGSLITTIQEALRKYGEGRLHNEFPSLTLRPQGLILDSSQLAGTVRLGQSDTIIPIKGVFSDNRKAVIITLNDSGSSYGGTFVYIGGLDSKNTLLYTISQKNDNSTDLIVKTFPGYRTASLNYLDNLGYHPSDFAITFTNNENPFK